MKKILLTIIIITAISNSYSQTYKFSKKISTSGNDGWDYLSVDEVAQHLFVSHGNRVNVIDLKSDKTLATIPDTKGVHGIAVANDLNKAFISNGKDNSITVVNLKTFELLEKSENCRS